MTQSTYIHLLLSQSSTATTRDDDDDLQEEGKVHKLSFSYSLKAAEWFHICSDFARTKAIFLVFGLCTKQYVNYVHTLYVMLPLLKKSKGNYKKNTFYFIYCKKGACILCTEMKMP